MLQLRPAEPNKDIISFLKSLFSFLKKNGVKFCLKLIRKQFETWLSAIKEVQTNLNLFLTGQIRRLHGSVAFTMDSEVEFRME